MRLAVPLLILLALVAARGAGRAGRRAARAGAAADAGAAAAAGGDDDAGAAAAGGRAEPLPPSRAAGLPWHGRLVDGRQLPLTGPGFATWDPILKRVGNRPWRRWGTDRLLRTLHRVLGAYARRHPDAPPVLVGDLSRPRGGDFGPRFGGIGHASHQNGLDADVYYPRLDRRLRRARRPEQVDRAAAQELVDAFVRRGRSVRVRRPVARAARTAPGRAGAHAP